ncbi:MAG: hypothetical protein M3O22_00575 [Pseudomonadota bacterium]|nr:hypothetical protein [Pseudomonadota bacterium]
MPKWPRRWNAAAVGLVIGVACKMAWTFNHIPALLAVAVNLVFMQLKKNDQKTALAPVRALFWHRVLSQDQFHQLLLLLPQLSVQLWPAV